MKASCSRLIPLLLILSTSLYGEGQVDSPIEWIDLFDRHLMVQKTKDGTLLLTPNEAFFPRLGLKAEGPEGAPDTAQLNGGRSFTKITGWDEEEQAEWGLYFPAPGDISITLNGSGDFSAGLDSGDSTSLPATLTIAQAGFHRLTLTCAGSSAHSFNSLNVTGPAATEASVVRKRWRPAAAHTKFESSKAPGKIRLWIMEMDAVPGTLNFYSPITTPFGYYGPTWNADGTVNTGFNFSLWSFGRDEKAPPLEQLSHLIAIGNPEATFGGFDHEGTGVKVRDWEPLAGRQGQRQALALRVDPGEIYDTYYSYFYAAIEDRWRFFGAGKKYNNSKPLDSLWVGSFMEVPGPPPVQRTGPYKRTMRYRGWVMDGGGSWYPLDRMQNGNIDKGTGFTHTDRGVTEDGWFYLTTGGWYFLDPPNGGNDLELPRQERPDVPFLNSDDLAYLKTTPSEIRTTRVERAGNKARVTFEIHNAGSDPQATLYWGTEESLTFAGRWQNHKSIDAIREGTNQHIIEGISAAAPLYIRLFLKNSEGQFWSFDTTVTAP